MIPSIASVAPTDATCIERSWQGIVYVSRNSFCAGRHCRAWLDSGSMLRSTCSILVRDLSVAGEALQYDPVLKRVDNSIS